MNIFDSLKNMTNKNSEDVIGAYDNGYDEVSDDYDTGYADDGSVSMSSASLQLKVVKPASFNEVTQIADHLLEGKTVVLNLEITQKEDARRLIDFLTGVVYSVQGKFKNVAANTFIITPHDVDVTGDPTAVVDAEDEEN
ncbi:MAG: cell division protein SepF [Ruminococcaceae bacterium]|nr:cell division protein SepF [Oscillospiraceae bacterium]